MQRLLVKFQPLHATPELSCRLNRKLTTFQRNQEVEASTPPLASNAPTPIHASFCGQILREYSRHGLSLRPNEMRGKVLRQQRIGLRARNGLLRVLRVFLAWTGKSNQRGSKFHLCVVAAKRNRLFHQS